MNSQKFQLTEQYKRKQKNVWIFIALFFPIFHIITSPYGMNTEYSWLMTIVSLIIFSITIFSTYFFALRKIWKYWVELEFRENDFIIYEMGKQKHFVYSQIKEVIFCRDINKKSFYVKLVLPKKNQYIVGFEREEEIIKILEDKIEEYNIKRTEKVRYINKTNYYYLALFILILQILLLLVSHYFIYK